MTGDAADLVRYRLARAMETLDEARLLLEHGKLHGGKRGGQSMGWLCFLWCWLRRDYRGRQRWLDEAYRSGRIGARRAGHRQGPKPARPERERLG